jgi:hypothetical protein
MMYGEGVVAMHCSDFEAGYSEFTNLKAALASTDYIEVPYVHP